MSLVFPAKLKLYFETLKALEICYVRNTALENVSPSIQLPIPLIFPVVKIFRALPLNTIQH